MRVYCHSFEPLYYFPSLLSSSLLHVSWAKISVTSATIALYCKCAFVIRVFWCYVLRLMNIDKKENTPLYSLYFISSCMKHSPVRRGISSHPSSPSFLEKCIRITGNSPLLLTELSKKLQSQRACARIFKIAFDFFCVPAVLNTFDDNLLPCTPSRNWKVADVCYAAIQIWIGKKCSRFLLCMMPQTSL